ncbi:MAG: efflux RND transporter periplasmic adaptor subunit [Cyanobacteria bacterium P01_A01_bin.123]
MKAQLWTRIKPIPVWVGGIAAAVVVGGLVMVYFQQRQGAASLSSNQQTILVERQNLTPQIQASGVVQAESTINVSPEDSGKIAELFIQEGDVVAEGQIIARMTSRRRQADVAQNQAALAKAQAALAQSRAGARSEDIAEAQARVATAQASLEATRAKLQQARQELTRFQQLADQGAVSANELGTYITTEQEMSANLVADQQRLAEVQASLAELRNGTRPEEIRQAEADVAQAEAQLAAVQVQLEETVVRAPFDGVITRRFADTGDFVTPTTAASSDDGATSSSIAELSSGLEIEAKVPEANIAKLAVGQPAEIRSNAYPDQVFTGEITLIAPRAIQEDNITVFRIKVAVENGQAELRSGMNVRITFLGSPVNDAVVIPLAAVVTQDDGETGVYLESETAKPTFQPIQIGLTTGTQVEVVEGLNPGDRILIEPPSDLVIEGVDNVGF